MTTREEIDLALAQLSASGELEVAKRAVTSLVTGLEDAIHTRVFRRLGGEEPLSAEEALNAWVELHAYQRLRQRLTQALKMGQSASEALVPAWEQHGSSKGE